MNGATVVLEVTGHRAFGEGGADLDEFFVDRNFGATFGAHQGAGGTGKVLRVAGNVETDDITTEQTLENLLTPRKDREHIIPWKWCVVEKGDLQVGTFRSDVSRSQPEVVIVHPYRCAFRSFFTGRHGELLVDLFKNLPIGIVYVEVGGKCMKDWPETFLGSDVIKTGNLFIFQGDPAESERRRIVHLKPFCALFRLIVDTSPSDPSTLFATAKEIAKGWNNAVGAFLINPDSFPVFVF